MYEARNVLLTGGIQQVFHRVDVDALKFLSVYMLGPICCGNMIDGINVMEVATNLVCVGDIYHLDLDALVDQLPYITAWPYPGNNLGALFPEPLRESPAGKAGCPRYQNPAHCLASYQVSHQF